MTEQQNTIQRARDVLKKWRKNGTAGRWEATADGYIALPTAPISSFIDVAPHEQAGPLIVGTAGNPELLDAIDAFLEYADLLPMSTVHQRATRLAAAILSAEERMNA